MSTDRLQQVTRRTVLQTGASGAAGVAAMGGLSVAADSPRESASMYASLGIQPIINAAGTITALGGSIMPPEVIAAWTAASRSFVNLLELQDRVGEEIARLLKVEAALVTTGAAGGILVGTAAAVTHRDSSLIGQLPSLPAGKPFEVIRQKSHRECYDQQVRACGVRLVDVETRQDLEEAINDRTVMMFSYNIHEGDGKIAHQDWIEIARRRGIPTLLDAAADTPPLDALWRYNTLGYDMVVFSGGKGLRGPQDAGLLLGRKHLIESAKRNTAPHCGNIGRGLKVSKEDMVAMWAAVQRFVNLDHAAEHREWERRIGVLEQTLVGMPTVETKRITPPIANQVPHLLIFWDEQRLGLTRQQLKEQLAQGSPPIATARVHGTGEAGFLISVWTLQPGEDAIVAARLRSLLLR